MIPKPSGVVNFFFARLPLIVLEWLLIFFARMQFHLLKVKGNQMQSETHVRGKKKKSLRIRRKSEPSPFRAKPHPSLLSIPVGTRTLAETQRAESAPIASPFSPPLERSPRMKRSSSEDTFFLSQHTEAIRFEANQQQKKEFEDFLRGVKDIKDISNWLKNYSHDAPRKIAIVKISRRILETSYGVEHASSALSFMYKFGLQPIVIHGGLNELAKYPRSEILESRRSFSASLKESIRKRGVGATVLREDICEVEPFIENGTGDSPQGSSRLGLGFGVPGGLRLRLKDFNYEVLTSALDKGKIPIWDSVANMQGVAVPLNSDVTTCELATRLHPYRVIFACNDGGIIDQDHKLIPVVYMDKDFDDLMAADWVSERRKIQLENMKLIVDSVPSSTAVVVSSMEAVTHQLFYPRLASETLIKKHEEYVVRAIEDFSQLDTAELKALIEDSFGRPLVDDYFTHLQNILYKVYLVDSQSPYQGCAIITFDPTKDKIPYLCKFCVRRAAQGLGLGDLLWRSLQRDMPQLYWRSRAANNLNPWYFQRAQASFRGDAHFTVFWYGVSSFEEGLEIITEALAKPITVLPFASETHT